MSDSNDSDFYKYTPSVAGAAVTAAVFGILTLIHGYRRALSASQRPDYSVGIYVASQISVLVAPSLLAASMYMELGRIIRLTDGPSFAIMRITWLTKVFVFGDVVAFLVQMMAHFSQPGGKGPKVCGPLGQAFDHIYVCTLVVLIRVVVRLIEYSVGEDAYLMTNEWVIYVFDALLMLVVMIAFAIIHPARSKLC
ncbi:hypothetical protein M409DRAFT_64148 [Zasmidium cellare ATCC 36951]|uniref:RTA1 like protein n=1 Tax=Zasmidium cellare ATCC 36951 TaxID=1080233 RepID=A0A6A6CW08_ZASCE|nr:uncharacterized protein M409DRAFT_64148 [Zasmidium cellare ATCC 36951]KAF2170388.1 hypothetical protein M409DRAFT_64148 [Zasmidium cellare ATCC 36951]